ncbi:MAG: proline--tRNA ligase [Clostridiales bacterium]|nr:proline--tRNA ligase [Clostridiales bacterium]
MRLSKEFFYTLREDAKDEESVSGNLLVKSGMFKKISNGIYIKMPLGLKVINNVSNIVRKCMNEAGATELSMPMLLPIEYFEKAGRKDIFGKSMFSLHDRYDRQYALGPTHEEFFTVTAMNKVNSYKDLPFTIYQIGNKYRDEIRPRLGLIRVREFLMKDAYSFDTDLESLDESYKKMYDAYHKIFKEVGLDYVVVTADTGAMGGLLSEEFQAVTDIGEDILVLCDNCSYSSNVEVSKCVKNENIDNEEEKKYEEVYTPNAGKIEDVVEYLNLPISKFVKTMIYNVDSKFYACMVEGDREINETKLAKVLNAKEVCLAEAEDVIRITNAQVGFAGPIGLDVPVIMDENIKNKKNFIVGANKTDYHYINVNLKDFDTYLVEDIKNVKEGDKCPVCGGNLHFKKGIEVGNTFKLGTKYAESLGLMYTDNENKLKPVYMGCYGIGIERIIASIVEQNNDEKGIVWPINVAPFKVGIVLIDNKNEEQLKVAEELYTKLNELGIDTLLDDRKERPGVKFNDMDLIGLPIRITVGKKVTDNLVEIKLRKEDNVNEYEINNVIDIIKEILK